MFQTLGIAGDFFESTGGARPEDMGRYNVTKREEDRFLFKVPSLRNVALTAPYFHNGSAADLNQAVQVMAQYQLGLELETGQVQDLVAFLESLTGELPR